MSTSRGFGLVRARRDVTLPGGMTSGLRRSISKEEVEYWDFAIDGVGLYGTLNASESEPFDLVGLIDDTRPIEATAAIEELLGWRRTGDMLDGRVVLYGCPECGSTSCGAITADVRIGDTSVDWIGIGHQYDYSDEIEVLPAGRTTTLTFDRAEYEAVLIPHLERLRPLCATFEYPDQTRRRLRRERRAAFLHRLRLGTPDR